MSKRILIAEDDGNIRERLFLRIRRALRRRIFAAELYGFGNGSFDVPGDEQHLLREGGGADRRAEQRKDQRYAETSLHKL